ncbi:MAG: FtsX-like permease family protein [Acidobacteriota bacterium]
MMFVLRMAGRETRAAWRRLLFFFLCIAVGVAAIVTLRSVIESVRGVFGREAKALIAADVLVSTTAEWTDEARQTIDRRLAEFGSQERTESIETPTMSRPADGREVARMVELRAVQSGFPLYGTVGLQGGQTYSHALLRGHGALVRPELLTALGLQVGDQIGIGQTRFTIRGVITTEPGRRVGGFSLGPRVLIDFDDLPSAGLLGAGSRARRVLLVRAPETSIQPLVRALRDDFRNQFVAARSYRSNEDEVGRDFERAENYLSLVGLVIVILGGIAISSVTRVFIAQKIRSIAVLKCLGARSTQIMVVYILQVLVLGLAGSLLGVLMARTTIAAIPLALGGSTSILAEADYGLSWSAAAQGVTVGLLVSLLFSVVPLMQVRHVKPSLLLRDESSRIARDWARLAVMALVGLALIGVAGWQAGSLRVGAVVCCGFAGLAVVLQGAGRLLIAVIAPLARSPSFPLRHAVLHLSRPGNQTRMILFAVGLGAFFVVGVRSLQASLLAEFSIQISEDAPDMFLLDIQRDQADGVRAFLADPKNGAGNSRLMPVLRARVVGVSGRDTTLESFDDVRARGSLAREYTVTYRDHLESNERITDGTFWTGSSSDPEVSVELGIHERFAINVGDVMRFDILGRTIAARVSSVREVDWRDARSGGFMFVFRPGALDQAPQTYIAPLKGPADAAGRGRFQHDLVEQFPNVSVIDFHEILETVRDIMSKVTLAVTVVGGLVLFSGALILIGAVAMTKFQRVYEAAVLKTLGANTRTIAKMLLFEYGMLGSLAGVVGSLGAVALTWGVSRYALEIPWRLFAGEHVGGVVLTAALVAAIGVVSSLDVLRHKPLATLRAE